MASLLLFIGSYTSAVVQLIANEARTKKAVFLIYLDLIKITIQM